MLNLEAFSLAEIQSCLHILNVCEGEGVTDARFVKARLAAHVHEKMLERRSKGRRFTAKNSVVKKLEVCPECGSRQVSAISIGDDVVIACKICRWSRLATTDKIAGDY